MIAIVKPPLLTAQEIAEIRQEAETWDRAPVWQIPVEPARTDILRLCDAAEALAARDAEIARLRAGLERAQARYQWARPILCGDDDDLADKRAVFIARGLMFGRDVDDVIDTAIAAAMPRAEGDAHG